MRFILTVALSLVMVCSAQGQLPTEEQLRAEAEEILRFHQATVHRSNVERSLMTSPGRMLLYSATPYELGLSPEQSKALSDLIIELRADMKKSRAELELIDDPAEKSRMYDARHEAVYAQLESFAEDIMSDEQLAALETLTLKHRFRDGGLEALLRSADIAPDLRAMTAEELDAIAESTIRVESEFSERLEDLAKRYEEERREIEQEMQDAVLEPLSEANRRAVKELIKKIRESKR
ncbi:MAG: hypothetical protein R3C28_03660 [Pirellulaceae bacterium]